jgi:hypothetical protein
MNVYTFAHVRVCDFVYACEPMRGLCRCLGVFVRLSVIRFINYMRGCMYSTRKSPLSPLGSGGSIVALADMTARASAATCTYSVRGIVARSAHKNEYVSASAVVDVAYIIFWAQHIVGSSVEGKDWKNLFSTNEHRGVMYQQHLFEAN